MSLGERALAVTTTREDLGRRVDALLEGLPDAQPAQLARGAGNATGLLEVRIADAADPAPGALPDASSPYELHVDGELVLGASSLWEVEDELLARLNSWCLAGDPTRVHLHAALVGSPDGAVLITGESGAGKSTLTATLVRDGWTYHTDETVAVERGGEWLIPTRRPLTLKRGSWPAFAGVAAVPAQGAAPAARERVHVAPAALGVVTRSARVRPALIVFLDHGPGATERHEITRLEAIQALAANSLDLSRAGAHGLRDLIDLAVSTPAVRLHLGDRVSPAPLLLDAMAAPVERPLVEPVAGARWQGPAIEEHLVAEDTPLQRRHGSSSWVIEGDGAIVFDARTGVVVRLDLFGAAIWRSLSTGTTPRELARDVSVIVNEPWSALLGPIVEFLGELARSGFVEHASERAATPAPPIDVEERVP